MTSVRAVLRRVRAALLATQDAPRHAAFSLALGVFISFSPLLGLQIAIALLLASTGRFNRLLLLVGLCTNLPWFCPAYYAATTEAAAWMMGIPPPSMLAGRFADLFAHSILGGTFWRELLLLVRPLVWPFVVGSFVAATALALVAYALALSLASARGVRTSEH